MAAGHVFHWRHGWIPLDHEAAVHHHGSKEDLAKADRTASHEIKSRRDVARAVTTLPKIGNTVSRHHAARATVIAAHRIGATDLIPPALAGHHDHAVAVVAAEHAVAAATRREPRLTAEMHTLAGDVGGRLDGLDHRLKDADSTTRKIENDVADGKTMPETIAGLFDINRYTIAVEPEHYATGTQQALDALRAKGYTVKVKNFWNRPDNPYQGVNAQITDKTGAQYELQLNTPDSLAVKNGAMHKLYEQYRVEKNAAAAEALLAQMHALAATIPVPPGIHQVR